MYKILTTNLFLCDIYAHILLYRIENNFVINNILCKELVKNMIDRVTQNFMP